MLPLRFVWNIFPADSVALNFHQEEEEDEDVVELVILVVFFSMDYAAYVEPIAN
jgi:hypothetical protein